MLLHLVIETIYKNDFTDSEVIFASFNEKTANEKRDEQEQKNRVALRRYNYEYTLSSVEVELPAALQARVTELEGERDKLKFLLLRCQQMNYTADGEDAALWNINGDFEQIVTAALAKGAG